MKQLYPVKITLPNGRDRLLIINEETGDAAITSARTYLLEIMTDGGYLSGEDADHEIEDYIFNIATKEEVTRLQLQRHIFKREEIVC